MPATHVLVLHDDGRWYLAQILGQHRDRATRLWRVGVAYYVDVGMHHQRVVWADECRVVDSPPEGWVDPRRLCGPVRRPWSPRPGTATRPREHLALVTRTPSRFSSRRPDR